MGNSPSPSKADQERARQAAKGGKGVAPSRDRQEARIANLEERVKGLEEQVKLLTGTKVVHPSQPATDE